MQRLHAALKEPLSRLGRAMYGLRRRKRKRDAEQAHDGRNGRQPKTSELVSTSDLGPGLGEDADKGSDDDGEDNEDGGRDRGEGEDEGGGRGGDNDKKNEGKDRGSNCHAGAQRPVILPPPASSATTNEVQA